MGTQMRASRALLRVSSRARDARTLFKRSYYRTETFGSSGGQAVTPAALRASADKMLDYYVALQQPDGSLKGFDDPCHYCKLPNALVWGGRIAEADRMLDYCVNSFQRENGDFTKDDVGSNHFAPQVQKTLHWEFYDFYAYLNQWWITSGIRLSRFDFIGPAYSYVLSHWYNPTTKAGILQAPLDQNYENCIFTSAHLGFSMLHMGDRELATSVGDTIVEMVGKQPHLSEEDGLKYYNRFNDNKELLMSFDADDKGVKLAAIVDGESPTQCWWSLGYPASFMAHLYMHSGDARYLQTAETILEFASRCHPDIRNNIVAHKVMWACSLVGQITGKQLYWDLCRDIAGNIINEGQVEDGRVLNGPPGYGEDTEYGHAQIIDQTGEIAYWFHVVAAQMEKAERAGRLA